MTDTEFLLSELAMYGIRLLEGGRCEVMLQKKEQTTLAEEYAALQQASKANKQFIKELWSELSELLSSAPIAHSPGSDPTQRMFGNALVWLNTVASQFPQLHQVKLIIERQLKRDVATFSEAFMAKVIQYRLVIDWVDHLIRLDLYKCKLLNLAHKVKLKTAQSGPWTGGIYLNDDERVIDGTGKEDPEDAIKDHRALKPPFGNETQIPETYNDPSRFEEGFYYREIRNEPYAFGDEDENPYPHRNLLWQ
jgi:hypothetical protein